MDERLQSCENEEDRDDKAIESYTMKNQLLSARISADGTRRGLSPLLSSRVCVLNNADLLPRDSAALVVSRCACPHGQTITQSA